MELAIASIKQTEIHRLTIACHFVSCFFPYREDKRFIGKTDMESWKERAGLWTRWSQMADREEAASPWRFHLVEIRKRRNIMLHYAAVFFVIAIIAAVFGFGGIAAGAAEIAKILFFIFLIIFVVTLIMGLMRR